MRANLVQFSSNFIKSKKLNHSLTCIAAALITLALPLNASVSAKSPIIKEKILTHIVGNWKTPKGDIIGFYKCGKQLCGKIVRTTSGLKKDKYNTNPKLRKRSVNGLTIMRSVRKSGIFKWYGYVYNVKDGQTYKGSLQLTSIDTAKLTGCGSMGICESVVWKKMSRTNVARK